MLTASPCTTLPGSTSIDPPTLTTSRWTTVPCGTTRSPWNTRTTSWTEPRENLRPLFDLGSNSMPLVVGSGAATTTRRPRRSTPIALLARKTWRSASRGSTSFTSMSIRSFGTATRVNDHPPARAIRWRTSAVGTDLPFSEKVEKPPGSSGKAWGGVGGSGGRGARGGTGGTGGVGGTGGTGARYGVTSRSTSSSSEESSESSSSSLYEP